jgi:type IV fimbrial biogenesis protein FimT
MNRTRPHGFTLIELIITLVILVIIVVLAAPSFVDTLDRRRVINATQALTTQIQQARSLAITRNAHVTLVIDGAAGDTSAQWCFGLTTAASCDCTIATVAADACLVDSPDPDEAAMLVRSDESSFPGVVLGSLASTPLLLTFEPTRGLPVNWTLDSIGSDFTFESPRALRTRIEVSRLGRIETCSPSGTLLGGITPC